MLDVAVDADGAAMHDPAYSGFGGGSDELTNGGRVDGAVRLRRGARLPIYGGDVINDVNGTGVSGTIPDRARQRVGVQQVADYEADTGRRQVGRTIRRPDERADLVAAADQRPRQVSARESRCAGYEDAHRSATTVTGDPNRRKTPARSKRRSIARVKRTEPTAL
jgi:hypothetical protein